MELQTVERKNYYGLDVGKFICAVMILAAHFVSERCKLPKLIDMAFSMYIFAVPFFFATSSFLFFSKINAIQDKEGKKAYFIKYESRIWIMYLIWSVIYNIFRVACYFKYGVTKESLITTIHSLLVYSSYGTIWFLPALGIAIAIVFFMRNLKKTTLMITAILLYTFCCLGYSYSGLQDVFYPLKQIMTAYDRIFLTTRNGVFNGVPFVIVGYFISTSQNSRSISKNALFAALFSILTIVEAVASRMFFWGGGPGVDTCFSMIFSTYFIVCFCIQIDFKERKVFYYFRKLSLLIFTSQRLFLSAIPSLFPVFFKPYTFNPYLGLILMISTVVIFDLIILKLSDKVKVLRYLI